MPGQEKSETLIVDTAAFVKNVPLWEIAERLITCEDVIYEIKDKPTQRQVEAYPVPIEYRSPTAESIKFINEFTKKTGDYAVLSAADVKVLALAYEIEVETHGSDHLRLEPMKRVTNNIKVVPLKNVPEESEDATEENSETKSNDVDDEGWCVIKNTKRRNRPKNDDGTASVTSSASRSSSQRDFSTFDLPPGFHFPKEKNPDQTLDDASIAGEESDDDDGWITPDNVNRIKKGLSLTDKLEFEEDVEEDIEESSVACITGDFAMQNVLHHIGLRVLGVDGKVIKDTRTYTLRCFACYKLCPDMTKLFCPNCGNRTLKRVSITLNSDGSQNVWISSRRINTRGMRFNLPKPRSGKHARMPLMTADQRFPHQWAKKTKNVDVMSAEYMCRSTPFSQNDITSRAAQCGYRKNGDNGINGQLMHARIWKPKRKH